MCVDASLPLLYCLNSWNAASVSLGGNLILKISRSLRLREAAVLPRQSCRPIGARRLPVPRGLVRATSMQVQPFCTTGHCLHSRCNNSARLGHNSWSLLNLARMSLSCTRPKASSRPHSTALGNNSAPNQNPLNLQVSIPLSVGGNQRHCSHGNVPIFGNFQLERPSVSLVLILSPLSACITIGYFWPHSLGRVPKEEGCRPAR